MIMESIEEHLKKVRQERIAKEKARIDKLRELNLKKYNKNEAQSSKSSSILSLGDKTLNCAIKQKKESNNVKTSSSHIKNKFSVNGTSKRPLTQMPLKKPVATDITKLIKKNGNAEKTTEVINDQKMATRAIPIKNTEKKNLINSNKIIAKSGSKQSVKTKNGPNIPKKSLVPIKIANHNKLPENQTKLSEKPKESKKSMLLVRSMTVTKNGETVFERLSKLKMVQRDPVVSQEVSSVIANKTHTITPKCAKPASMSRQPVRRSISAVDLERTIKKELENSFHKWSSVGEKLDEVHVTNTNEDDKVKQEAITPAMKNKKNIKLDEIHVTNSVCKTESHDATINSDEPVDDILIGALKNVAKLLLEHSVVDANLEQPLDKIRQLKTSPNGGKKKRVDSKLVDLKNVFKSTIIRFAVQQAKPCQSNQSDQPIHIISPERPPQQPREEDSS